LKRNKWIKFEDRLPSTEIGAQIDILVYNPIWSCWHKGLFTYFSDGWDVAGYNWKKGKWDHELLPDCAYGEEFKPIYWLIVTELPK